MIPISDYIFERSIKKQFHLHGEKGGLISGYGNEASLSVFGGEELEIAEVSFPLFFEGNEIVINEEVLLPLQRKLMCKGASFSDLRADIIFFGKGKESNLRTVVSYLSEVCEKMKLRLRGLNVYVNESGKGVLVQLLGGGALKNKKEAPWQEKILIPGQGIVITGSIGRGGSLKLFKKNEKELAEAFPKIFVEKMRNRIPDRLPYLELDNAPFFGVTSLSYGEEGGLLASLYRLGDRDKAGLRVYADRLFYDQETIEIAEYFNKNPLELSSEGVYVMAVNRAEDFVESLRAAGLPAVLAGEVTEEKKRVILFGEEERFIESPGI